MKNFLTLDELSPKGLVVLLPVDAQVATEFKANAASQEMPIENVQDAMMMLDIGSQSVAAINKVLESAKTVVWNGPLGAFETPPFHKGTVAVAQKVAELTKAGKVISVAGGGDTVSALAQAGVEEQMTYVSTAGGAFLEWLEGKTLPGVEALEASAKQSAKAHAKNLNIKGA